MKSLVWAMLLLPLFVYGGSIDSRVIDLYLTKVKEVALSEVKPKKREKPTKGRYSQIKDLTKGKFEKTPDFQKRIEDEKQRVEKLKKQIDKSYEKELQKYHENIKKDQEDYEKAKKKLPKILSTTFQKALRTYIAEVKITDFSNYNADDEIYSTYVQSDKIKIPVHINIPLYLAPKVEQDRKNLISTIEFEYEDNRLYLVDVKVKYKDKNFLVNIDAKDYDTEFKLQNIVSKVSIICDGRIDKSIQTAFQPLLDMYKQEQLIKAKEIEKQKQKEIERQKIEKEKREKEKREKEKNIVPKTPTITLAQIQDQKVILNWSKDDRLEQTFNVFITKKGGLFSSDQTAMSPNIKKTRFEHKELEDETTYIYSVQAVNKYNYHKVSAISKGTQIKTPDLTKLKEEKRLAKLPWKDTDTKLIWQKKIPKKKYKWDDAKQYCEDLTLGGYSDWKLPSRDELKTIHTKEPFKNKNSYNKKTYIKKPLLKSMDMTYQWFWSSSEYKKNSSEAWNVFFSNGFDVWNDKTDKYFVRCVRQRQ